MSRAVTRAARVATATSATIPAHTCPRSTARSAKLRGARGSELTAKVASALKGKCGTRGYWAPEMVKGDQYIYSADWWSLGVMITELITGKKPFKKRLQKFKNTDDKVKIVGAGGVNDEIEERDIEAKLGAATQIDEREQCRGINVI